MTIAGYLFIAFFLGVVVSAELGITWLAVGFLWAMAITILLGALNHCTRPTPQPEPKE